MAKPPSLPVTHSVLSTKPFSTETSEGRDGGSRREEWSLPGLSPLTSLIITPGS